MSAKQAHHQAEINYVFKPSNDTGYTIKPRGLNIVWGNDSRYWKLPEGEGPIELMQVSWLEVSGVVKVEKGKTYQVEFDVRVKEDGFGWNGTKVLVMAKPGKRGKYQPKQMLLSSSDEFKTIPENDNALRIDVPFDASDSNLHFGLYEVWSGKWKGGLEIKEARLTVV